MNKTLSFLLLVCGIALFVYGVIVADFIGSGFTRFFSSTPSDKTIWIFFGGGAATILGLSGLLRASKAP